MHDMIYGLECFNPGRSNTVDPYVSHWSPPPSPRVDPEQERSCPPRPAERSPQKQSHIRMDGAAADLGSCHSLNRWLVEYTYIYVPCTANSLIISRRLITLFLSMATVKITEHPYVMLSVGSDLLRQLVIIDTETETAWILCYA